MRRRGKPVGSILFEELFKGALALVVAVVAGIVAYYVVVGTFAEAIRQPAAP